MHTITAHILTRSVRHTTSVAAGFWAVCLVLTLLEAAIGASVFLGGLFFLSIPVLVACLTWANFGCVWVSRGAVAMVLLGTVVLVSSSLIILLGLLASSGLLSLITGAGFGA